MAPATLRIEGRGAALSIFQHNRTNLVNIRRHRMEASLAAFTCLLSSGMFSEGSLVL